ncbi:SDR family oxidoreductase [Parvibaculaceae bacterium PLY_AMNH_Bact1]|nr:SDR family oxidoreductase [Parvibaculaceae bacterium PLY_AMNH_Bact1]
MTTGHLFAFGFGSTAFVLAARLQRAGWRISGTCRASEKAEEIRSQGVEPHLFSAERKLDPSALDGVTHVLVSIPPGADGDPVLHEMREEIAKRRDTIKWIGYLSTTGVYGDRAGGLVDETMEMAPTSDRGRRRQAAEEAWFAMGRDIGVPVQTFRLAGICGPDRNQIVSLRTGKARRIVKPGHVFSRIHVEDIASVLEASIVRPNAGAAYNVCDDEAAPPQDVVAFAADLIGMTPPPEVPFEDADLSPMARSFYAESKRVSNKRIKEELGVELRFPTYREGLRALAEAGD